MGFSQVVVNKGYSLGAVHRLLPAVASLIAEHGLSGARASVVEALGLNSCSSWALEHRLRRHMGLVVPQHVGFSQIKDQTCVSFIGRQILCH